MVADDAQTTCHGLLCTEDDSNVDSRDVEINWSGLRTYGHLIDDDVTNVRSNWAVVLSHFNVAVNVTEIVMQVHKPC